MNLVRKVFLSNVILHWAKRPRPYLIGLMDRLDYLTCLRKINGKKFQNNGFFPTDVDIYVMRVYRKLRIDYAEKISDKCIHGFHNGEEVLIPISQTYDDLTLDHCDFWIAEWVIGRNMCGVDPEEYDVLLIEND